MTTTVATPATEFDPTAAVPRLRIAYLLSRYPAISHTFLLNEILSLRALGIDIEVASINASERPLEKLSSIEAQEAKTTYYIKNTSHVRAAGVALKTLLRRPRVVLRGLSAALSLDPWDLYDTAYSLFYLAEALLLGDWMVRRGHTHLHIHFCGPVATVGMLASIAWGIPYSVTVHGPDEFFNVSHFHLRRKIERAQAVFCISHYCKSQLARLTTPEHWDKMHVVRLGIDPEVFVPRPHDELDALPGEASDPRAVELLCVGRLVPAKGQLVLLRAFVDLLRKGHNLHLRLVGDGPDRARIERFIREQDIALHVTMEGSLLHEQTRAMLRRADIFVLASFAEGVPVALMEAMAMEIPCVSTYVAGIPELIRNGLDGLLVAASSSGELSTALETLILYPEERARLGVSGRNRVLDLYTLSTNTRTLAAAMRQQFRSREASGPVVEEVE